MPLILMTNVNNSAAIKNLIKAANLQVGFDEVPSKLASSIVPTININPDDYRICDVMKSAVASNATSATIYTTPTDKDFFLTNLDVNVYKDATSTSTYTAIELTVEGVAAAELFHLATITLTAQDKGHTWNFPFPIKLKRGTTVKVINATNNANIRAYGSIVGYTVENNN